MPPLVRYHVQQINPQGTIKLKMGHLSNIHLQRPTRESLGLTNWVRYEKYDPHAEGSTDARKSLSHLDYSPLRRVTMPAFLMGIAISMGGFIFGYDTGQISGYAIPPT